MKKILVCLLAVLLCACANVADTKSQLEQVFNKDDVQNTSRANNYTFYIEYYMPSDVNEESAETLSYVFNTDGEKFIMNINVASILNSQYYENYNLQDDGFFNPDKLVYEHTGSFANLTGSQVNYFVKAYEDDSNCIIYLVSSEVTMYGMCSCTKAGLLASKMYQMAKSSNVHRSRIIEDFSNKDVIDYEKVAVNLFEKTYPVEGRVDDLMVDSDKVPE